MNYQNYLGNNPMANMYQPYISQRPFYPNYQQGYQMQVPNQQIQQQQQPQQNYAFAPIRVIFANSDEAKGYMVLPNENALLIDRSNHIATFKTLNGMGDSISTFYTFEEMKQEPSSAQWQADLSAFAKKEDLSEFATKQDMQAIVDAIGRLQRQIKINEVERGNGDGK